MTIKVDDAAAAVLSRAGTMETMKLQKLLYYCQAWHAAITDQPLFNDTVEAWQQGPVVRTVWEGHRGQRRVSRWTTGSADHIDGASEMVIDLVCSVYGRLSGDDLSELTHDEEPWRQARHGLPDGSRSNAPISLDSMKAFYRQRTLNGRYPADIAAGGTEYAAAEPLTTEQARAVIDGTLRELGFEPSARRARPTNDGGDTKVRRIRERPTRAVAQ